MHSEHNQTVLCHRSLRYFVLYLISSSLCDKVMNDKGILLPHPFLEMIEAVCIAWFTLEYIVR